MGSSEDTQLTAEVLIFVLFGAVWGVTATFYTGAWNWDGTRCTSKGYQEIVSSISITPRGVQPDIIPQNAAGPHSHEAEGRYDNK